MAADFADSECEASAKSCYSARACVPEIFVQYSNSFSESKIPYSVHFADSERSIGKNRGHGYLL